MMSTGTAASFPKRRVITLLAEDVDIERFMIARDFVLQCPQTGVVDFPWWPEDEPIRPHYDFDPVAGTHTEGVQNTGR